LTAQDRRFPTAEEVAALAVRYLAGAEAAITGQTIVVDGELAPA
jgi:NAD(P)-dependent dehydrogenase (short-subunit alcohol dehydrogenase family)